MVNSLHYGDNLDILRGIADASIDLIYLDPPFNSNATYNVLFRAPDGRVSDSQIEAFGDTWHWGDPAARAYEAVLTNATHPRASKVMRGIMEAIGPNDVTAYLSMMAVRLIELRRVLKPTGSLYLHCDPGASHYLKVVMDGVFGPESFRNEVIWKRTFAHGNVSRRYGAVTDTILFYAAGPDATWNQPYNRLSESEMAAKYSAVDPDGRRWQSVTLRNPGPRPNLHYPYRASNGVTYQPHPNGWSCNIERMRRYDADGRLHFPSRPTGALRLKMFADETLGERMQSLWADIPPISANARERLGYPTQKPLALLERIIETSSNPGDVVLDPFCGCGTAVHAAEKLGRRWIGIDITHLAISLIERRLKDAFTGIAFTVHGTPRDMAGARDLARRGKHQFEYWAVSLVDAVPQGGARADRTAKQGADRGIDGIRWVRTGPGAADLDRLLVSVKGGETVGVAAVRDLAGTVQREGALGGILITLATPTRAMLQEAAGHGFASTGLGQVRRIMVKTVDELLRGVHDEAERLPPLGRHEGFRRAPKEAIAAKTNQNRLDV